ncbi:ParB N-terminal domain-containing protein [uncultured Bradyrhizobium sp.]|uniref:ParB/RepB/Spo0J family partition protein n=1 Tax=uncultured Bradyrhizobium sp. TaxID=199684 RepID=UPI00260238E0|nr:ParB N-terminal domain-containing protein [uncultured Bradyrhizobium sp.]
MTIVTRAQTLKIADIEPAKPNRALSTGHVKDLVESFGATAFASAVVVRPTSQSGEHAWTVVAGFHRVEAARNSGQAEVHAIVVENATDLQLELIQIDENILHWPLTEVQEARALARRKEIYQQLNPATKRGGDRRSNTRAGSLKSFAKATAAATGRSVTAINRAVARADNISESALKMVQGTPIETGSFLDRLAKVPVPEQEAFVANAMANPEPTNSGVDVQADLARLRRCWSQSCAEARKIFLAEIGGSLSEKKAADL